MPNQDNKLPILVKSYPLVKFFRTPVAFFKKGYELGHTKSLFLALFWLLSQTGIKEKSPSYSLNMKDLS